MATELKLNGIPKNGGFLLSNKGPIDVRTVVAEYSHLSDLISGNRGYVGMLVYVNSSDSNKGLYICESITNGGSWKPVATSSSTGDISLDGYATEKYVDDAIKNIDIPEVNLDSCTSTSVLPNNGGEIKTKYRIAKHGYTNGTTWYFKLCDFPINNNGNYAGAIISGRIGGWVSNDMSYINALVWNRGTPSMSVIDVAGDASAMSSIWNAAELVLYTNSDASATLYIKCYQYFAFDIDLELYQGSASITYDGTYTEEIAGIFAASSSTSTRRLELINSDVFVAGTKLSKEGHQHFADYIWYDEETSVTTKLNQLDTNKLSLYGGNLTGALTVNGAGGIDTDGYVTSTWLKTTDATDLNKAASKVAVIDASGWIYYRTPAELMSDMGAASKTDVNSLIEISSDGKTLIINI